MEKTNQNSSYMKVKLDERNYKKVLKELELFCQSPFFLEETLVLDGTARKHHLYHIRNTFRPLILISFHERCGLILKKGDTVTIKGTIIKVRQAADCYKFVAKTHRLAYGMKATFL